MMSASASESSYFLGSINSATETDSNNPGPGRLLGKAYGFFGRIAEDCLSEVAVKLGLGPRATAMKIRRLVQGENTVKTGKEKELKKAGKRLVKFIRSNVASTQDTALCEVIHLAFEDEQLRLLLKVDCVRTIGLLQQNRSVWYNIPKPIQSRAHRALIALADENASIKELIGSLRVLPRLAWPQLKPKLEACLSHESYSFVATRHLRRIEIYNYNVIYDVVDLLLACLNHPTDLIEWTEYDGVLATRLITYIQRNQRLTSFIQRNQGACSAFQLLFANSLSLPETLKSSVVQSLDDGFDSKDIDVVVRSYSMLFSLFASYHHMNSDDLSEGFQLNASKLDKRLATSPDRALATICSDALAQPVQDKDAVANACRMLAELVGSEDESVRQQAWRNARIALCVNRYIRHEMATALSRTSLGHILVSETERLCRPSDCPGRGRFGESCKRHSDYHHFESVRHCDANGNLFHINNSYARCDGECEATELHIMQFDRNDVMHIEVPRDKSFKAMSDHHPVVAGRLPDGRQSYIFDLVGDGLQYVGFGPTPEEACFLQRSLDEKLILASPSPSDTVFVRVLRYDPDAYMHCDYYADKWQSQEAGMDSTGPFSWKFSRYLPAFYRSYGNVEAEAEAEADRAGLKCEGHHK